MNSLIIGKNPIYIDEEIATVFGLTEAIIIQKIWYWMKISRESKDQEIRETHFKDGRWWTYQSLDDWCKALPFISRMTIRRHLEKLEKLGVIVTGEYNKMRIDRTKWYSVNDDVIISKVEAYVQSEQLPSVQNEQTNNHKNTIPKNTLKFRNTNRISKEKSDVFRHIARPGWFDFVDIHNKENLASVLDGISQIPPKAEGHDFLYVVFSTFADTYKKKRRHKHATVEYSSLLNMADKLVKFTPKAFIPETGEYEIITSHTFSIFDYNKDELIWMVKDYFEYQFDDCDYSLWHFMSDNVLSARFWRMENRRTESVI